MEDIAKSFMKTAGIKTRINDDHTSEIKDWIKESVIDFEKKDLNPILWSGKQLKKAASDIMWKSIDSVLKEAGIDKERLTAVIIEGSNLTVYYNKYTDIDMHLYIEDVTDEEKEKMDDAIGIFNKKGDVVPGSKNVLEMYLMDAEQVNRVRGPRYDLIKEKWLTAATKMNLPVETYKAAVEIALTFARDLDLAIGELKRDIIEYIALGEEVEDMLNVDVKRLEKTKTFKSDEIKADIEALVLKQENLKDMRRRAYSEEYDPKEETLYYLKVSDFDRAYTLNNIIFKILQRFGYIDPLKMIRYDVYSEALKKKDFDKKTDYYLKKVVKILSLFNKINITDEDLTL